MSTFSYFCPFISISFGSFPIFYPLIIYLVFDMCMVQPVCNATWVVFSSVHATCFAVCPRTATSSVYREHCHVQLNIVPSGFVFTFLVTFSIHILSKRVDNSSPCLIPTTISKLGDIFPCFSGCVFYYYF